MRRLAALAGFVLVALSPSTADARHKHRRGCNTSACDRRADRRWAKRHPIRMQSAMASWFSPADSGGTPACGLGWPINGVANKTLRCGSHVRMCAARCVTAVIADRGPFIAGREFDLMPGLKASLGCSDLCSVRWRPVG